MINVTKSYLPELSEYMVYLQKVWDNTWLTNRGPLALELEEKLKTYLGVKHLLFCGNGTLALQIAIRALKLKGEIITTPFSYVATTSSILWENCMPVFIDIEDKTMCINADLIEAAITPKTTGIMATHVYGYPCDVEKIEAIAKKHGLKVIYDAAHAFGVKYKGRSLSSYGDIATLSFHATKIFHTVEGGAIISNNPDLGPDISLLHSFGHIGDDYYCLGINAKNSEIHAAMGLCILPKVQEIIAGRKAIADIYNHEFSGTTIKMPAPPDHLEYNYAYYPVVFENEKQLLKVKAALAADKINTRRYFYPSLNRLPYVTGQPCPVSENIAAKVLSLPLYYGLEHADVRRISAIIKNNL